MMRNCFVTRALVCSMMLLPLFVCMIASADTVSDFEINRLGQLNASKSQISAMPDSGTHSIDEVLRIRMENGNFLIRSPLPSTEGHGYARAIVAEVDQPVLIRIERGVDSANSPPIAPGELLLQWNDYSQRLITVDLSMSQSADAALTIVECYSTPTIQRSVQLSWQKAAVSPSGGIAQLIVKEMGPAGINGPGGVRLDLTEPDCATLIRRHPQAVDRYIRPLFDRLAQQAALAPDAMLALQVFPENIKADPQLRQKIDRLLPELGDPDFRRRDRASAALEDLGMRAAVAIIRMDRSQLTPEQNNRLDRIVSPLGLIPRAEAERMAQDREFLLNCLYCEDPVTRRSAADRLSRLTAQTIDFKADATLGERTAAVRELRKQFAEAKAKTQ